MFMLMKRLLLILCNFVVTFVFSAAAVEDARRSVRIPRSNPFSVNRKLWFSRPKMEWYSGGLLGVGAEVLLDRERMVAHITLKGPVFAGAVSGRARFADANAPHALGGGVVIDEPLRGVLKRRFVSISNAQYDVANDVVIVQVKLPAPLGKHTITLHRV
jgi:hypothetical protein